MKQPIFEPAIDTFDPQGKRVLFISAHPDDADFGAGGTVIKWLKQGACAAIVIATNGDKGAQENMLTSKQLAKIRKKEQLAASQFLGLEHTWFLDYPDAHLEISQQLKKSLVRIIRAYRPDVVFTFDPSVVYSLSRNFINHPDHRAIGQAALDAIFPMARDFLTFPEHKHQGLEPHKVTDMFLYNFDKANYFVDIASVIDQKFALLQKHDSQINAKEAKKLIYDWAKTRGAQVGLTLAESFIHLTLR